MKILKKVLLAILLVATFTFMLVPLVKGTPEYAKKENRKCTFCHTAVGKPDLNEAGKYYKDNNYSLEGFEQKRKP